MSLIVLGGSLTACGEPSSISAEFPIDKLMGEYSQEKYSDVRIYLNSEATRSYQDLMDLGAIYLFDGEYAQAVCSFEVAAREGKDIEVAKALYFKALALQYCKKMELSLQTIDLAARIAPDNLEIATMRSIIYSHSEDLAGMSSARSHLVKNNPNNQGKEVLDPITAFMVLGIVTVVAATAYASYATYLSPPGPDGGNVIVTAYFNFLTQSNKGGLSEYYIKMEESK